MNAPVSRLSASPDEHSAGWKFYFKLYCFLDTERVPPDGVEFAFMFEQVSRPGGGASAGNRFPEARRLQK